MESTISQVHKASQLWGGDLILTKILYFLTLFYMYILKFIMAIFIFAELKV